MDENVIEEKKLSEDPEEVFSRSADDSREAESKSDLHQYGQPLGSPVYGRRRSNSYQKKSNFGKIGLRKPDAIRSVSVSKSKRPLHRRARTLMHLSHVHDLPTSPPVDVSINKDTVAAMAEFRAVLSGLSEQINQMEQRFDKQLGAFHKRFDKMEKLQLTILANIRKLARSDESAVKTMQQNAPSTEIKQDMISGHI